jgi:hypothetical protein
MSLGLGRPINNYVVLKMEPNETITMPSGVKFFLPPPSLQENKEVYKPLRGQVVSVPELRFVQGDRSTMDWKTDMELEVGDNVIVRRPALSMALGKDHPSYYVENGELFIYLKYQEIVVAKRGDHIIVLNGYCIIEPLIDAPKTSLHVPDMAKKNSRKFGIIRYLGKPNQEYHISKNSREEEIIPNDDVYWARKENGEIKIDIAELEVGDKVMFKESSAIPLEPDILRTIGTINTPLYRVQRPNIQAKL